MKLDWKTCFRIGVTFLALFLIVSYRDNLWELFTTISSATAPLIIGGVIAYVANILMSFYEKHYFPKSNKKQVLKTRRPVCLIGAFATVILAIVLIISLVVPQLISCASIIIDGLPAFFERAVAFLQEKNIPTSEITDKLYSIDWQSKIRQIIELVVSGAGDVFDAVIGTVSSVFSGLITAFIAIIFSAYLLASKEKLISQGKKIVKIFVKKGDITDKATHIINVMNSCFRNYIIGQCTEAVILGVLCTLGMLILRLPYATMIGPLIAFTALIPIAGAYIGAFAGAFMILTVSPAKALIFLVFLIVLQQFEGNIIYPKVVGASIGLPGIWVLAAVTVGGGVMGILGMLLGVPLAATAYHLLKEVTKENEKTEEIIIDN